MLNERFLPVLALVLLGLTGCGDGGPRLGKVHGIVTLDGKPLQGVYVMFQPSGHPPSGGVTDSEGRYQLSYVAGKEGAIVGRQEVFLQEIGSDEYEELLPAGIKRPSQFPAKFMEVFESVEVKGGDNEFNFELTSD